MKAFLLLLIGVHSAIISDFELRKIGFRIVENSIQSQAIAADAILGKWQNEGQDAHFEIFKQGSKYFGKIIWGKVRNTTDVNNPNEALRKRELVGLVLLTNLTFDGEDTWENGQIYDPNSGDTYSCEATLNKQGYLNVRGYIGISLFGRTETWTRI